MSQQTTRQTWIQTMAGPNLTKDFDNTMNHTDDNTDSIDYAMAGQISTNGEQPCITPFVHQK